MIKMIKWYFDTCCKILVQPILFYTLLPEGEWTDKPVTTTVITAWILAAVVSLIVFITQFVPIGGTLLEGISGFKFIIILPVLLLLIFMFYLVTFIISGGAFMAAFLGLFYLLGIVYHYSLKLLGSKAQMTEVIKGSFYASVVVLAGVFPLLLLYFVKKGVVTFSAFVVGYNVVYYLAVLYLYGLFSIAGKKITGLPRGKAFLGALVPVIILIIIGLLFGKIILPKIEPFIV